MKDKLLAWVSEKFPKYQVTIDSSNTLAAIQCRTNPPRDRILIGCTDPRELFFEVTKQFERKEHRHREIELEKE